MSQIASKWVLPGGITNLNLAQMGAFTIKGNNTGSLANAADLSVAQVMAMLTVFGTANGLVPGTTSNTTNFLRADGSWAVPPVGSGTVTSVSVSSGNGFAGSVSNATTTPAITISTSISGILKGNGTALQSAAAGTDYSAGTAALATGILKSTTSTGALTIAVAADFPTLNQNTTGTAASVTGTNVVTNTNLAQMGAFTIKGNNTGSTANAADLSVAQVRTLLNGIIADGSVAFTADQSMGGHKLTNLSNGVLSTDAATYGQLTSMATGLLWQSPVGDPDLVDDSLSAPPGTPVYSLTYIVAASPTGVWTGLAGHAVWWDGVQWIDLSTGLLAASGQGTAVQVGDRFGVAIAQSTGPAHIGGGLTGKANYIAVVTSNTPGSIAYTFVAPVVNWAFSVNKQGSQHYNQSFTYNGVSSSWVDFSGPSKVVTGNALGYSGNTLNVLFDGVTLDLTGNQLEIKAGGVSNTQISSSAAISYSKLASMSTGQILLGNAGVPTATTMSGDVSIGATGTATIAASSVTLSKMANLAALSIIGNNTGSAATPLALSQTQVTAMLNTFTSGLQGLVPASGGGTVNFLRADGTWTVPTTSAKDLFVLASGDITHQYIDLSHVAQTNSIELVVQGGGIQIEGASYDYSVSYTGGVGGVTRITFLNGLATTGASALVAGDVVVVQYRY
jgi:hypothetical protein